MVVVLLLLVLSLFLVAGALNPPARLRTRPATATPHGFKPAATAALPGPTTVGTFVSR